MIYREHKKMSGLLHGGVVENDRGFVRKGVFFKAQERVGRPLTPMSYAEVAEGGLVGPLPAVPQSPIMDFRGAGSWTPTAGARRAVAVDGRSR